MAKNDEKGKPNPEVKDNGDGTKTLIYRQTEDQKEQEALERKLTGKK